MSGAFACGARGTRNPKKLKRCPRYSYGWVVDCLRNTLSCIGFRIVPMFVARSIKAFLTAATAHRRAGLTWLVIVSFLLQAGMSAGHFHTQHADASVTGDVTQGTKPPAPHEKRGDMPCVFCQQAASAGHALAPDACLPVSPGYVHAQPLRLASGIAPSAISSFGWLSRAPPAA